MGTMQHADRVIDLTDELCPMTFVRTRLALDAMAAGQSLLILLRGDEPRARVPRTILELGHTVLQMSEDGDVLAVLVRKKG